MTVLAALIQSDALTVFHKSVRDRFQQGGSVWAFILAAIGLVAFIVLVYWLTRWQRHAARPETGHSDPRRLFEDVIAELRLTPHQRQFLQAVAENSGLEHPTVLLLSERTFDQHTAGKSAPETEGQPSEAWAPIDVGVLRQNLFPDAPPTSSRREG